MRNWKQRLWSLLLCGAMLASLCPTARAEDVSISYLDQNGDEKSCETYTAVTADSVGWNTTNSPSGWYVVESSVKIEYSVNVTGEVHLILANGCDLKVIGGIKVSKGSSLTIYAQSDSEAMGKLTATGSSNAGIGGGGNITINGGTVTATSDGGAGIGGGYMSDNGGNITINGGTVNATSQNGAGIGGGRDGAGGAAPQGAVPLGKGGISLCIGGRQQGLNGLLLGVDLFQPLFQGPPVGETLGGDRVVEGPVQLPFPGAVHRQPVGKEEVVHLVIRRQQLLKGGGDILVAVSLGGAVPAASPQKGKAEEKGKDPAQVFL